VRIESEVLICDLDKITCHTAETPALMNRNKFVRFLAAMLILGGTNLLATGRLFAGLVTVEPVTANSAMSWPLNVSELHWQQVYDHSWFGTGPVVVDKIGFLAAIFSRSISFGPDFTVRMSTTTAAPGGLSTTFAANAGPDESVVFANSVTFTTVPDTYATVSLTTPFVYDPTQGNLLVDISHSTAVSGEDCYLAAYNSTPPGLQRIATNNSSSATAGTDFGSGEIVTQFDVIPLPEPGTFVLGILGTVGMLGSCGYRRRRNADSRPPTPSSPKANVLGSGNATPPPL